TIVNRTLFGHEFFDGTVIIIVISQPNYGSLISIRGTGTNDTPGRNELVGELFFGLVSHTVTAQCATDHGIPGRRLPGEY
ncbi:MAG: hypothetical protein ACREXR_18250, partial [Gammaproteobacteria bacterium]